MLCWTFVGGRGRYLWCVSCWWAQRSTDHRNICVPGRTNHYTNSDTQNHPINGESEIWFFFFSSDVACMSFTWKRVYKCMDKSKSCAIVGHLFFLLFLVLRLRHSYLTHGEISSNIFFWAFYFVHGIQSLAYNVIYVRIEVKKPYRKNYIENQIMLANDNLDMLIRTCTQHTL